MEDNKAAPSVPPQGGGASRRPLGFCCLPFGKDFLSFASLPGPNLGRFPEFGPDRDWDPSRISKSYSWGLLDKLATRLWAKNQSFETNNYKKHDLQELKG